MRGAVMGLLLAAAVHAQTGVYPLAPLNQNTTGTSANITGVAAIANGGTGATTAAAGLTALGGASLTGVSNTFSSGGATALTVDSTTNSIASYSWSGSGTQLWQLGSSVGGTKRIYLQDVVNNRTVLNVFPNSYMALMGNGGNVSINYTPTPTTALTVNGSISTIALATPGAPTVTPTGAAGSTSYSYVIVAKQNDGSYTAGGAVGTTATGNATLDAISNWNSLTWTPVTNAANYDVYRTVGGATQGKIATGLAAAAYLDQGGAGSGSAPTVGTAGNAALGVGGGSSVPNWTSFGGGRAAIGYDGNNISIQGGSAKGVSIYSNQTTNGFTLNGGATPAIYVPGSSTDVLINTTTDAASGAKLQVAGNGVQLVGAAQPTCDAAHAGLINYSGHTASVKDTVAVCASDVSNSFAWRTLY